MPKKVLQEPGLTLWHLANVEFKEPKVVAHLMMRSPSSVGSAFNQAAAEIFDSYMHDKMVDVQY